MIRTVKSTKKCKWKKIGGGSLRLGNRIIKPNQVFFADPGDIPAAFMNLVVLLDNAEVEDIGAPINFKNFGIIEVAQDLQPDEILEPAPLQEPAETAYELKKHGTGWYDVVNTITGKAMNAKRLRLDAAKKLAEDLNK